LKTLFIVLTIFAILFTGTIPLENAFAQADIVSGGIKGNTGTWWLGENLKKGDLFSYELCFVFYKDCTKFRLDLWIEGDIQVGTESKWLAQVVVYDGPYVITGNMELGKIAPEPTGGSKELGPYRSALKSSVIWLSSFANADTPKEFNKPSWGKIANIGGQQIIPTEMQTITVPEGTFETARISWRTGGQDSNVWVLDDFPFPIKAYTFVHVSSGIPPTEYEFQLLDYKENVLVNPFTGIVPKLPGVGQEGCVQNYELVSLKKPTSNFGYIMDVKYGPSEPEVGCNIEWFIGFKNKFSETEFLSQVQYDILVVDNNFSIPPLRTLAGEDAKNFFFAPSGFVHTNTLVKENPGTAHYVIYIYGTSPEYIVPPPEELDYLQIDIPISGESTTQPPPKCDANEVLVNGQCVLKQTRPQCASDEILKDGECVSIESLRDDSPGGGGCLIATATYGSELAPQVQFLREVRDNTVLSTSSGAVFMTAFNEFYYSFSPTIADWERQNPAFKEAVKLFITPMISSLSIMTLADSGSEAEVLAFGISVIALNIGLYIVAPTAFAYKIQKHYRLRN
jgi:hypothetical protein